MRTADDFGRLEQEAIETIVFHATPREWLRKIGGPWVLERGEGALLYDVEGGEYLDALSGGVFAVMGREWHGLVGGSAGGPWGPARVEPVSST